MLLFLFVSIKFVLFIICPLILFCIFCFSFCRDVDLTERLDYSSAVALLGYSLILAIVRVFNVRDEAARVMVAAPLLAFVTTHILYLNFYQLDYGKSTQLSSPPPPLLSFPHFLLLRGHTFPLLLRRSSIKFRLQCKMHPLLTAACVTL